MDANLRALQHEQVVLVQRYGGSKHHLFMGWDAGEGSGKPMPVCSDLDLLLIAGHGEVQFPPLLRLQEQLRKWCANHCASIVPHVDRNNVASSFRCLWGNMLRRLPPDFLLSGRYRVAGYSAWGPPALRPAGLHIVEAPPTGTFDLYRGGVEIWNVLVLDHAIHEPL